ncbi:class I SAM-dependent methyltransferase [Elioraea thermophila]|uniref:class I SAM-dependent methyltransferase n=1 Tax=Elioraea thermophila TaxID=2185104 RepID=UPI000DF22310|nr:class I SAM-dependent methyltransferase [Elioraea thermophila]
MATYDQGFYATQADGSYRSARVVLAHLREILPFASAIDVGCGAGTWVKALLELGAEDVLGIDGEYARSVLRIPHERFLAHDLRQPVNLDRRFDLALSLEVAEHLPAERAAGFVADLVCLAPAVLFSAAIPLQGGTNHVNERWQHEWARLFADHGYRPFDVIRPRVWTDERVEPWYRQNTLLFLTQGHPQTDRVAQAEREGPRPLSLVHPSVYPLGYNIDNIVLLAKMIFWSVARRTRRLRGRRKPMSARANETR